MSGTEQEEGQVWPPPPAGPPAEAAPPKRPSVTDQTVGRVSLALSGLGSLGALAYALCSATDFGSRWNDLWAFLNLGNICCLVLGFFVGIVGWYSWEGKVALALALISPLWAVVALVVEASHGP